MSAVLHHYTTERVYGLLQLEPSIYASRSLVLPVAAVV